MNRNCFLITILWLPLLASCLSQERNLETYATIPVGPEPSWLTILHPAPGQSLSLADYRSAEYETYRGSLGVSAVPDSVCVSLSPLSLLIEGDQWETFDVVSRTEIMVDEVIRELTGEIYNGLSVSTLYDDVGNPIASVSGPKVFCVAAKLGPGTHRAEISFEQTNGIVSHFAWTFTITEGPTLTPTLFPTPLEVDNTGEFPAHVRTVFPFPGSTSPMSTQAAQWSDLAEVFRITEATQNNSVCIALFPSRLEPLGVSPENNHLWHERVRLFIDGVALKSSQSAGMSTFWEEEQIQASCYEKLLAPGKHTAILVVEPFSHSTTFYSWSFDVTE